MKQQKGFAHIGLIVISVAILSLLAFTWYRISNRNDSRESSSSTDSQDSSSNAKTKPSFESESAIYTDIYDSIESTSPSISVGQQDDSMDTKLFSSYSAANANKQIPYTSKKLFTVNKKCDSSCGDRLTPEGHLSGAYYVSSDVFKKAYNSIVEGLLAHEGVVKTDSGTVPGTYSDHDFTTFSVTLKDKKEYKLEVSTNKNDSGQMFEAVVF